MDKLSLVLLVIRTAWREDAGCSAEDLVYDTGLHVTGEFFSPTVNGLQSLALPTEFLRHLQDMIRPHCTT